MPQKEEIIKAGGLLELGVKEKQSDMIGFRRTSGADVEPARNADESHLWR